MSHECKNNKATFLARSLILLCAPPVSGTNQISAFLQACAVSLRYCTEHTVGFWPKPVRFYFLTVPPTLSEKERTQHVSVALQNPHRGVYWNVSGLPFSKLPPWKQYFFSFLSVPPACLSVMFVSWCCAPRLWMGRLYNLNCVEWNHSTWTLFVDVVQGLSWKHREQQKAPLTPVSNPLAVTCSQVCPRVASTWPQLHLRHLVLLFCISRSFLLVLFCFFLLWGA